MPAKATELKFPELVADHKRDIYWIIKLWLDIHGGDPPPERYRKFAEKVTIAAISALAENIEDSTIQSKIKEIVGPIEI